MAATSMVYVGALRGEGTLRGSDGSELGRAEYDIGGFLNHTKALVASGELRMHAGALQEAFAYRDLVLQTDTGLSLALRFSGKRPSPASGAAHVDITDGLPTRAEWPR